MVKDDFFLLVKRFGTTKFEKKSSNPYPPPKIGHLCGKTTKN